VSWQAVTWVLEKSEARLGSRLVLLSIASHANREGRDSWPSVNMICLECRLSRREVQYALRALENNGELRTTEIRGRSNRYSIPQVEQWIGAQTLRTAKIAPAQSEASTCAMECAPPAQPSAPELSFKGQEKGKRKRVHKPNASPSLSIEEQKEAQRKFLAMMKRVSGEHDIQVAIHAGTGPEVRR
jgi:hypothetical protein